MDTNEFITQRKTEIDAEIEKLKLERRQLVAAELVAKNHLASSADGKRPRAPETIKEQVVKILTDQPGGLEAKVIRRELLKRFGRRVKRESLSPQLSRLGSAGIIQREGTVWILPMVDSALNRFKGSYEAREARQREIEAIVDTECGAFPILGHHIVSHREDYPEKAENPQEVHS